MPVINAGYEVLNNVLFGQPSQSTTDYFAGVQDSINERTDLFASDFIERSKSVFKNTYSSRAVELARAAVNKAGSLFSPDIIKELVTMTDFQMAKPKMRRYLMANPFVREMWQDNKCEGYGGDYIDHEPGTLGENHYDYRRVVDGIVRTDDKSEDYFANHYFEELRADDEPLTVGEQLDIYDSWPTMNHFMRLAQKDPTSSWNCDL